MAAVDVGIFSLNAGEISRFGMARVDHAKLRMACEQQRNWLPQVLGPAALRPGFEFIEQMPGHAAGWLGEFYFDEAATALLVITAGGLQFLIDDAWLSRVSVATAITNGEFTADLGGWTDGDEAGATSSWSAGRLALLGTGVNFAYRDQVVTVAGPDVGVEHGLRVTVAYGTIVLQVGTAIGDNSYIDAVLLPGSYSLAFTPTANFWIRLGANDAFAALVYDIAIEGAGNVSLPVPWSTKEEFDRIRYDQSGDVVFVASTKQQRRIERRDENSRSWGIALYLANDGPFRAGNTGTTTLAASGTNGSISITASNPLFKSGNAGSLWRLTHTRQTATASLAGENQFTDSVRVAGLSNLNEGDPEVSSRAIGITVVDTFSATVTLQRSLDDAASWIDIRTYTVPTAEGYDDGLDNQIAHYRLGIKTGDYTSGSASATLTYAGSTQNGIVRITEVINSKTASADVLKQIGSGDVTSEWAEGEWSDERGWPAAVAFQDGRLGWFPNIRAQLSVSDGFASFDDTVVGDSGPINRAVATGGFDGFRWALGLQRLVAGTAAQIVSMRSSAFDEPLAPTAFTARTSSTDGAARIRPVRIDTTGVYVGADRQRVHELYFDIAATDYRTRELTKFKQEMCEAGVADIAVQRSPVRRLWLPLDDGICAALTYDTDDDVVAWTPVETDGVIERVAVLPSSSEDRVYCIIKRVVNMVTRRYIEKLAKRTEMQGGTLTKCLDSFVLYSGAPTTTITGLGHLEAKTVGVWADGAPVPGTFVVSGAQITGLPSSVSEAVVGLPYTGRIKTTKLNYGAELGSAISQQKRVARVGLIMADTSWRGVRVGRDFSHLTGLPATYRGKALAAGQVLTEYDARPASFNGGWDADSRVCIEVTTPNCCTLMGLAIEMRTNEPDDPPKPKQ